MFTALFLIICLGATAIFFKRSTIYFLLLCIVGACIMGYNYDNADYDNYVIRYEGASYPDTDNLLLILDFGSEFFQAFVKDLGIREYGQFHVLQAFIAFVIMGVFAFKNCYYRNMFIWLYIFSFLVLDTIQLRNFLAFIILLPFIPCLGKEDKKSHLLYVLGLVIATSYHFSMVFFSIFLLLFIKSKGGRVLVLGANVILFTVFAAVISQMPAFDRVSGYTHSSVLGAAFMASHCLISTYVIAKVFYPASIQIDGMNKMALSPNLMRQMNMIFLFIVPLFLINASISRMFRYIAIINIMYMLNVIYSAKGKKKQQLVLLLFLYALYFGFYYCYMRTDVYVPVFTKNNFLN